MESRLTNCDFFPTMMDMQIPLPPPTEVVTFFMKYAECAETKEKSYFRFFRFLFFKLS